MALAGCDDDGGEGGSDTVADTSVTASDTNSTSTPPDVGTTSDDASNADTGTTSADATTSGDTGTASDATAADATSGDTASADTSTSADTATAADTTTGADTSDPPDMATDMGMNPSCDFETVDGVVVFEMESLPLNESWMTGSNADASGGQYIEWTGSSHNNDPTNGVMSVAIRVDDPGRYRLWIRNRIGMGTNTTEHNDIWARFPDADDYYGVKTSNDGTETRRYAKPQCEDATFMDAVRALADVSGATCAAGSTRDGWMKVYSSGANDWKWSSFTSDNDAHSVVMEVASGGVYTLEIAARADFQQLDRGVFYDFDDGDRSAAEALTLQETACQ